MMCILHPQHMHRLSYPLISATLLYTAMFSLCPTALDLLQEKKTLLVEWVILSHSAPISLPLILDPYGTTLSVAVLLISSNVIIFAHSYMSAELFLPRFTILVLLFVASINLLIYVPNLITLLLG